MDAGLRRHDVEITESHFQSHLVLVDHVGFLSDSIRLYDEGKTREARRMATVACVLLEDGSGRGSRTSSILSQLQLRNKAKYISTARPVDLMQKAPLLIYSLSENGVFYIPHCAIVGFSKTFLPWIKQLDFRDWWNETIYVSPNGQKMSRKELVSALRSQHGGAHFDEVWRSERYKHLATIAESKALAGVNGDLHHLDGAHLASMRQIGWELDETLRSIEAV